MQAHDDEVKLPCKAFWPNGRAPLNPSTRKAPISEEISTDLSMVPLIGPF